jgi:hypothetical protein
MLTPAFQCSASSRSSSSRTASARPWTAPWELASPRLSAAPRAACRAAPAPQASASAASVSPGRLIQSSQLFLRSHRVRVRIYSDGEQHLHPVARLPRLGPPRDVHVQHQQVRRRHLPVQVWSSSTSFSYMHPTRIEFELVELGPPVSGSCNNDTVTVSNQ